MDTRARGQPEPDPQVAVGERHQLLNLAYRLLGSLTEAEDAVQDAYVRWYRLAPSQRDTIESPGAWLTTVVGRICLDLLGSARSRRERYVGAWIPEPLPGSHDWVSGRLGGTSVDPVDQVSLDESISMAFLVVLESLTPAERVAFVLHDVFQYSFAEVAGIVGRTPAACRQLAYSARRRLRESRTTGAPSAGKDRIVGEFKRAWEARDIAALVDLLDPAARMVADGGGQVSAALAPLDGGGRVAHYLVQLLNRLPELTLQECTVNRRPGLVARHDGATVAVLAFEFAGDRITQVWTVRNPDKLGPWKPHP